MILSHDNADNTVEPWITLWRNAVLKEHPAATNLPDIEANLQAEISKLTSIGLNPQEAFGVALGRIAANHPDSNAYLATWATVTLGHQPQAYSRRSLIVRESFFVFWLAIIAALVFKVPVLFGTEIYPEDTEPNAAPDLFYFRNLSFFVFPFLSGYFLWKRNASFKTTSAIVTSFALGLLFTNIYPFKGAGSTEVITVVHIPIFLWAIVGASYMSGDWHSIPKRLGFIRFSGELFIYYTLIALGGGIFTLLTALLFASIGIDTEIFIFNWLLPCGAIGAAIIATGLVESGHSPIGTIAPTLSKAFTPLFAAMLLIFLIAIILTGNDIQAQRETLIVIDLLLVLVTGLIIYNVSARKAQDPTGLFDILQVVLIITALVIDVIMLIAIASRIIEFGLSPNKVAALGENIILFIHLAGSAWITLHRYFMKRKPFEELITWHMYYLSVLPAWSLCVVVLFPPIFDYI